MIVPVILSGGAGTRLWPLSRSAYPKQFLPLVDETSLFQATVGRLSGLAGCSGPLIISNEEHRFLVAEQLRQQSIQDATIMLEPEGRNTAPAAACAAYYACSINPDAIILVMPSDHIISDQKVFRQCVTSGLEAAKAGKLITFGIVPTRPETGYGYIRREAPDAKSNSPTQKLFPVAEFVEKPDEKTAKGYVASGDFFWNSGIFLFKAQAYLDELNIHNPDIASASLKAFENAQKDHDFLRLGSDEFMACPSQSIDYAIMEKTAKAAVIPMDAGWSDVGAWSTLAEAVKSDKHGNCTQGDVIIKDVENCYIHADSRLVTAVGINNLVVVESADAILVTHKDKAQEVKALVDELKQSDRLEHIHHVQVYRPWGSFRSIDDSHRFKVKRIIVNPGESLSLQMHHHRAEHWVVVKGTAKITRGNEIIMLSEDQSVYIPLGTKHRLENPGMIPLEIIEVQTGSYLGEDDIIRFTDTYGRDTNC